MNAKNGELNRVIIVDSNRTGSYVRCICHSAAPASVSKPLTSKGFLDQTLRSRRKFYSSECPLIAHYLRLSEIGLPNTTFAKRPATPPSLACLIQWL
jgi:hypothetical protein